MRLGCHLLSPPEPARLIITINPLLAAEFWVLIPILAALLEQKWRFSFSDELQSTIQTLLLTPPAPGVTPEHITRSQKGRGTRAGHFLQSRTTQTTVPHALHQRQHAKSYQGKGKPAVLLTNKVIANDINSFRSEWMTTRARHRRLHGEFTDGQAFSIKLSSPPTLLSITALKPLNYLNSISLRIFEASCSD